MKNLFSRAASTPAAAAAPKRLASTNAGGIEEEQSVVGDLQPSNLQEVGGADDREALGATLGQELDDQTKEMLKKVGDANKKKNALQAQITTGDKKITQLNETLGSDLKVEGRNAEMVSKHQTQLDELMKSLQRDAEVAKGMAGEKTTAAKRLQEEHTAAIAASAAARKKFDEARRLRAEAIAAGKAQIAASDERVIEEEALAASAKERLDAIRTAAEAVKQRLGGLKTKESETTRERDFHAQAVTNFEKEYGTAKSGLEKARELKRDNDAALESHDEDAAQRLRAHEAEVRRAKDKMNRANKLRDLRTRPNLTADEDKQAFAACGEAAIDFANKTSEEFSQAEMALDETRAKDATARSELAKAGEKSTTSLEQRDRVLQTLDERMKIRHNAAYEARKGHTKIVAAVRTAQEELDALNKRADGPLTNAHNAAEAKAEQARAAAQTAREKATAEEAPLRNSEEAETLVMQKTEEQEGKLVQTLSTARIAVAEAEADASLALGLQEKDDRAPRKSVVAVEGAARLQAHMADEQEAKEASSQAKQAAEQAKTELSELKQEAEEAARVAETAGVESAVDLGSEGADTRRSDEDADTASKASLTNKASVYNSRPSSALNSITARLAAAEVAVEELEKVLSDAVAKHEQAVAAVAAMKAEVSQSQKAQMETAGASTASLLKVELEVSATQTAWHDGREKELKGNVGNEEEAWKKSKDDLSAQLHFATLEFGRAKEDMASHEAFKGQYKS